MILVRRMSVLALCGLLTACTVGKPGFTLPKRSDPAVKQEEARVARVLAADTSEQLLSQPLQGPAHCRVRLLRKAGPVDYVYATCTAGQEGFSFPLKLVGSTATIPADSPDYAPSIRRIFPADVAAALNADEQRYKP